MTFIPIQSVKQICERVRDAQQHNVPVYAYAGNTQQHLLAPASQAGVSLKLTALKELVDYPHRDLTITVQTAMTMQTLQETLRAQQQTLPIDVPTPSQATVGGSIAANINGPRRTGWGTWRDYLIGLSWVNDQGEEAKAGGRVVKNVAGYDFCKLFTGSLGTLGVITQVTLKVKPIPEKRALFWGVVDREEIAGFNQLIRNSRLRPTIFVVEPDMKRTWPVVIAFEDSDAAVDWQIEHLREISKDLLSETNVVEGSEAEMEIGELTDFELASSGVSFQAHVPRSQCAEFITRTQPLSHVLQAQPAVGIVLGHLPPKVTFEETTSSIERLRALAASLGGHVTLPHCPPEWRAALLPWGPQRNDWPLMRKVKQAMDPNNIFQRGRHEILQGG